MLIREYTSSDKPAILALIRQNTPKYFAPEEEADLNKYLDEEIELYYVVEIEGKLLACGGLNIEPENKLICISWDIVSPNVQAQGIGTALMQHRIAVAETMKEMTRLSVRTSQLTYKFYEKFGLELKELKKDYWAKGIDMYRLEKEINKKYEES